MAAVKNTSRSRLSRGLRFAALVWIAAPAIVAAQLETADPLIVPQGHPPGAASFKDVDAFERFDQAAGEFRERGYSQLPVLARSMLRLAASDPSPVAVARAVNLAPQTPAVRFEAAKLTHDPAHLSRAIWGMFQSYPALIWLVVVLGGALGFGLLLGAIFVIGIAFARAVTLHGHAFGHLTSSQDPPAWPGVLVALGILAGMPLLGFGPVLVVTAAAVLTAMRLEAKKAYPFIVSLLILAVLAGPGFDVWARFAAIYSHDGASLVAWRVERGQPLPGDRALLEAAVRKDPSSDLFRFTLATALKREGDLKQAKIVLEPVLESRTTSIRARARNLEGSLFLANGQVREAIASFDQARSIEESASVLYNLSQAYGRALQLADQHKAFTAARQLDPEMISQFNSAADSANLHRYLIDLPLPQSIYLQRALSPSPEAFEIAAMLRTWTLGSRAPREAWMFVALVPIVTLFMLGGLLRRSGIERCVRCERPTCSRCSAVESGGGTCVRCARLFVRGEKSDPRVRQQQIGLDRKRQQSVSRGLGLLALAIPGAARVFEGRVFAGGLRIFFTALGFGLLVLAHPLWFNGAMAFPAPFEVGGLGIALPLALALVVLVPLYFSTFIEAYHRLTLRVST